MKKLLMIILIISALPILASVKHVGRLIKLTGDVKIYSNPGKKITGPAPHVLLDGQYYSVKKARLGMKIKNGSILETGNKSKARIVYKNGDQFNVGEGTAYSINWSRTRKSKKKGSIVNLMRGKLRAIVSKKGPRNNMKVTTKFASMGVRGTDFFVTKKGNVGSTKLTVLRGEVALKVQPKPEIVKIAGKKVVKKVTKKVIEVKVTSGNSASFKIPPKIAQRLAAVKKSISKGKKIKFSEIKPEEIKLSIEKTNKKELVTIQKASVIKVKKDDKQIISKKMAKEFKALEKKCVKATLDDIKDYDKDLYEKAKKMKNITIAALNSEVVKKIHKKAPEAPGKPGESELDNLDNDAYDKYFLVE